ncbi:dipeptidase [Phenylobacterium sp.]|uniref:dipeptidase n=1 Tax=Phenylobacterium sp. TaxID=1871053 RepID=UPI00374D8E6C
MTTRRDLLTQAAGLGALAAAGAARAAPTAFSDASFHGAIVIDGMGSIDDPDGAEDTTVLTPRGVAALRQSGLTAVSLTVNVVGNQPDVWEKTIANIAQVDQLAADNPDILVKAQTSGDVRRAKREGKIALLCNVQDTSLVGADLNRLTLLKGLGVRIVQLTYNLRNLSGDGSLEPANAGLSKLGRATIARIEKERMLVDFSHGGQRTIAEGLAATTRPPIISHTGCRSLHDNPRNVWDAEMKLCADKGGVVGIYWMPFLVPNSKPTSADLIRHMQHVFNLCGEDHVSIGTDGVVNKTVLDDKARAAQKTFYNDRAAQGIAAPGEGPEIFNIVADWDDNLRFRHLADGLSKAGWTTGQIEKALGGNLMRVYAETFG